MSAAPGRENLLAAAMRRVFREEVEGNGDSGPSEDQSDEPDKEPRQERAG